MIGPDGKAWHSWRVLILPFFNDPAVQAIRERYSFEEPWDGPRNKQVLDMMPEVYGDAPVGKPADGFTRYAAVTGAGRIFPPDGVVFDPTAKPRRLGHGVQLHDVEDGAAGSPRPPVEGRPVQGRWRDEGPPRRVKRTFASDRRIANLCTRRGGSPAAGAGPGTQLTARRTLP